MMRRMLVISILLFPFCTKSFGQNDKNVPKQLMTFIPKGYVIIDIAKGDLNLDKYQDYLLVLKKSNEGQGSELNEGERPLLILLGNAGKNFTLGGRNDDVVYCLSCGGFFGDPYTGIEITKGTFTVHHFGGSNDRWSNDITFKYSKINKTWYLFKVVDKGWNVFDLNKIDSIVTTKDNFGVVSFKEFTSVDN